MPGDQKALGNNWSHPWQECKHDCLISGCFNPRKDGGLQTKLVQPGMTHLLRTRCPGKSGVTHSEGLATFKSVLTYVVMQNVFSSVKIKDGDIT